MIKLLSTKILDPLVASKARSLGIELSEASFILIEFTQPDLTEKAIPDSAYQTLIFTSANGVTGAVKYFSSLFNPGKPVSVYCLNGKTREALLANGIRPRMIRASEPDARSLAHRIIADGSKDMVFFCGETRMDTLPILLGQSGCNVHELRVYQTKETPVKINGEFDGVLFFSPSAVSSFFSMNYLAPETVCFAIGSTTAGSIAARAGNRIIEAGQPTQTAMLAAVCEHFDLEQV